MLLHIHLILQELRRDQWEQHCKGGGSTIIVSDQLGSPSGYQLGNDLASHITLLWFATPTEIMRRVGNVWVIYVMPKNNGWGAVLRIRDPGLLRPGTGIRDG
jgi:hypothetical protein